MRKSVLVISVLVLGLLSACAPGAYYIGLTQKKQEEYLLARIYRIYGSVGRVMDCQYVGGWSQCGEYYVCVEGKLVRAEICGYGLKYIEAVSGQKCVVEY